MSTEEVELDSSLKGEEGEGVEGCEGSGEGCETREGVGIKKGVRRGRKERGRGEGGKVRSSDALRSLISFQSCILVLGGARRVTEGGGVGSVGGRAGGAGGGEEEVVEDSTVEAMEMTEAWSCSENEQER